MKFTVHTDAVLATSDVGAVVVNETALATVAAVSVGAVPVGLTAEASCEVRSENVVSTSVVPLMTPMLRLAAVELASTQVFAPLLASDMTTVADLVGFEAVGVQVVGNVDGNVSTTVGVVETVVKPEGNVN